MQSIFVVWCSSYYLLFIAALRISGKQWQNERFCAIACVRAEDFAAKQSSTNRREL
jgi:hypothetical protein